MRIAVIDLGTNTFNLLIAEVKQDTEPVIIYKNKLTVKLGKGGADKDIIVEEAFQRGMQALRFHNSTMIDYDVQDVFAFGTCALRSASNGEKFVREAFTRFGIQITVIDGLQESAFIYEGIKRAVPIEDKPVLMLDIGGGSNEFILATQSEILWQKSFPLGIARLLEIFHPSEPITENEIDNITTYCNNELKSLFSTLQKYKPNTLIGSSGSFTTLFNMIFLKDHDPEEKDDKTHHFINIEDFNKLYDYLISTTIEDRMQMKGIDPSRIEMIVVAAIFIKTILNNTQISTLIQSNYALKEGVLHHYVQKIVDKKS